MRMLPPGVGELSLKSCAAMNVGDAFGGIALVFEPRGHEVEGDLNPLAGVRRTPFEGQLRAKPAVAGRTAFNDLQRAVLRLRCGGLSGVERDGRRAGERIIAGRSVRPTRIQRIGSVEAIRKENLAGRAIRGKPSVELTPQLSLFGVEPLLVRLPRFEFAGQVGVNDAIVWLHPFLDVERRVKKRLERIVILLRDRLELVVMTLRALDRQAEQAGADDLHRGFERVIAVGADLVRVAVALARAILAVAKEVSGFEQFDDPQRRGLTRLPAGQFIAGQLLANELIERFVVVQRADDIVAIAVGERTVAVGVEVAVRVGIARGIEPVLAPALAVARRIQVTFHHPSVSARLLVCHEARDLFRRWRQSGQDEGSAADERETIGLAPLRETGFLQPAGDETIDRVGRRCHLFDLGDRGAPKRLERPVRRCRRRIGLFPSQFTARHREEDAACSENCRGDEWQATHA